MKYSVKIIGFPIDASVCPPPIVSAIWPAFDGWPCEITPDCILVSVPDSAPAPADLGPLVRVELVPDSQQG